MKKLVLVMLIVAGIAVSGCAEKEKSNAAENQYCSQDVTTLGTEIKICSFNNVLMGYASDNPSNIMDIPEGNWKFVQKNNTGYFELQGRFRSLEDMPKVDIAFPNGKKATFESFRLQYLKTDNRGVDIYSYNITESGFEFINFGTIDRTFPDNFVVMNKVVDNLTDSIPPEEMQKSSLTEEEKQNGKVWFVRIGGYYY